MLRAFVVVSRQALIDSRFSTVVCARVQNRRDGLPTQVDVGPEKGGGERILTSARQRPSTCPKEPRHRSREAE